MHKRTSFNRTIRKEIVCGTAAVAG
jgi:hypothetical protein